jgi:hypothetical protein
MSDLSTELRSILSEIRQFSLFPIFRIRLSVPIAFRWVFWFRQQHAPGSKVLNYEEGIKKIASFSSVSCEAIGLCYPLLIPFINTIFRSNPSGPYGRTLIHLLSSNQPPIIYYSILECDDQFGRTLSTLMEGSG